MRVIGILLGVGLLFVFWPLGLVVLLMCFIPSPKPVQVGEIREHFGQRVVMGPDGKWHAL